MFIENFDSVIVSKYIYNNRNKIPVIDVVKINDFLYGRLDIIVNRYYPGKMEYLPLLMDFNGITDPTDLNIGRLIEIPDFDWLIENIDECKIFDDEKIPGVNSSMISKEVNESNKKEKTKSKTTAIPKLNITLQRVSYDVDTGVIKF